MAAAGRLALSVAGAVAGFVIGGPVGAQIGFALGSVAGLLIFGGWPGAVLEGPRLNDLKVMSSAPGRPRPIPYGTMRYGGNVIWSGGITEVRIEDEQGGKGGPAITTVSYSYYADFAIALHEECAAILQVFADGKPILDITRDDIIKDFSIFLEAKAMAQAVGRINDIRRYNGTATQEADPLIATVEGIDDAPAYRGTAYIVFELLPLADYGNRIPQITAVTTTNATASFPTATITPSLHGSMFAAVWQPGRLNFVAYENGLATNEHLFVRVYAPTQTILAQSATVRTYLDGTLNLPAVELEGHVYTIESGFGTTGTVRKWDGETFALLGSTLVFDTGGFNTGSISFYGNTIIVIGNRLGSQKVIYTDGGDNIACVGTVPVGDELPVLAEYQLDTSFPGSPGPPYAIADITVDSEGFGLVLARSGGNTETVLFKLSPSLGQPIAQFSIAKTDADLISYDLLNNNLLILRNTNDPDAELYAFSLDSETVTGSVLFNASSLKGRYQAAMRAGPVNGVLYLQKDTDEFHQIDTTDMEVVQTLDNVSWGLGASDVALYDSSTHAVISHSGGSTIMNWLFLDRQSGGKVTLGSIVDDIATSVGLTAADTDISELTDTVQGFVIPQRMTARAAMNPLVAAYFFDGVESDFTCKFPKRGGGTAAALTEDNIGARNNPSSNEPFLTETRREEVEMLERIDVTAALSTIDYQPHAETAKRIAEAVSTKRQGVLELPIAFDNTAEIAQIAEKHLYRDWIARTHYGAKVSLKQLLLDPADVVTIASDDATHTVLLGETSLGADGIIALEGDSEDIAVYSLSGAVGHDPAGVPAKTISQTGPTSFQLLDTPLLRDQDDGDVLYMAAGAFGSGTFPGVVVDRSTDGETFADSAALISSSRNAVIGYATSALAAPARWTTWDRVNSVTVQLFRGTLASVTELQALNLANAMLIGDEIIHFANATLNADGTYTLSTLLTGRRGTEWAIGTHAVGDRVVLLTDATVLAVTTPLSDLAQARWYRGTPIGGGTAAATIRALTWAARSLKPYAPADVACSRDGSPQEWTLTWKWRTRVDGEWNDFREAGFGEASETYEVDILDTPGSPQSDVVRTITSTISAGGSQVDAANRLAVYSEADQITDFGAVQSSLSAVVYQRSVRIGRGFGRAAMIE